MRRALLLTLPLAMACTDYDLNGRNNPNDRPDDDSDVVVDGPQPDIKVEPMDISFGEKLPDCPTDPREIVVTNVGDLDLVVSDIRLTGDATAYSLAGDVTTLTPGASATLSVVFSAPTTTVYNASIVIRSNDPDEDPTEVTLFGEGGNNPTNEDLFTQDTPGAVDVLWVLDNSCSMSDEVGAVEEGLDAFIDNFVLLGLDYQMGVTTTDMDATNPEAGKLQGPTKVMSSATMSQAEIIQAFDDAVDPTSTGSGSEKHMDAAKKALTETGAGYGIAEGLIRPNAYLSIILITDEDDSSGGYPSNNWVTWVNNQKSDPDFTSVSGLIQQSTSMFDPACAGGPSTKLQDVIDGTGGLRNGICELVDDSTTPPSANGQIVDQLLTWLSFTAAGLDTRFTLSDTPATGAAGIKVWVNNTQISPDPFEMDGWWYYSGTNEIVFFGSAIPGPSATVRVTYPVAGTCTN